MSRESDAHFVHLPGPPALLQAGHIPRLNPPLLARWLFLVLLRSIKRLLRRVIDDLDVIVAAHRDRVCRLRLRRARRARWRRAATKCGEAGVHDVRLGDLTNLVQDELHPGRKRTSECWLGGAGRAGAKGAHVLLLREQIVHVEVDDFRKHRTLGYTSRLTNERSEVERGTRGRGRTCMIVPPS